MLFSFLLFEVCCVSSTNTIESILKTKEEQLQYIHNVLEKYNLYNHPHDHQMCGNWSEIYTNHYNQMVRAASPKYLVAVPHLSGMLLLYF